jgi:hypothetical protein
VNIKTQQQDEVYNAVVINLSGGGNVYKTFYRVQEKNLFLKEYI